MTCCAEKREICFGGEVVVCSWRELGWGRRKRNRGGEGRYSGHRLSFVDGFTDRILASMSPSAILTVNMSRQILV